MEQMQPIVADEDDPVEQVEEQEQHPTESPKSRSGSQEDGVSSPELLERPDDEKLRTKQLGTALQIHFNGFESTKGF